MSSSVVRRVPHSIQQSGSQPSQPFQPQPQSHHVWGQLVTADYQASQSLMKFVAAVYNYVRSNPNLRNHNEEGLSPEQVGLLLHLGNYAYVHNPYLNARNAAAPYGSRPTGARIVNRYMATFYTAFDLDFRFSREGVPLLSFRGHTKWLLNGILIDPAMSFNAMNHTLQNPNMGFLDPHTNIPLPRSIPRHVFPAHRHLNAVITSQRQRQEMENMLQSWQLENYSWGPLDSIFNTFGSAMYTQGMINLNLASQFPPQ